MPSASSIAASLDRKPVGALRVHVVGLVLLALLLQAMSPLVHARLQVLHAALTGERIDAAAFCLPSHLQAPADAESTPPIRYADCLLCQGGTAPAADVTPPNNVVAPTRLIVAATIAVETRAVPAPASWLANQPRGPPAA